MNRLSLGARELELLGECVRSGWVSSEGPFVARFEEAWAARCDRRYGVAVSSGTTALQVAFACLELRPGDEVILPSFTIVSCALAVLYNGGVPVLVDSDPHTGCLDPEEVRARVGPRTRAILAVHIHGHPADVGSLEALCRERGIALVEDAAEAHGAEYLCRTEGAPRWRPCGSFGSLSCFSFYANKLVTTGEGGMLLTDDPELARRARSLRNLAFGSEQRYRHEALGFNFRMTNLQAAVGVAQDERLAATVARKREIAHDYDRLLAGLSRLELPVEASWARSVYWVYGVKLAEDAGLDAHDLARRLEERGIETRPFFLGMHEQPAFQRTGLFRGERYPVAERLSRRGLCIPSASTLRPDEIESVAQALREAVA
jgi:perosamine synthetase